MLNVKRGFTLIELLVVIAIIGILSGIVLTSLNSARDKARDVRIKSNVKNIKTQLDIGFNGSNYMDLRTNDESGTNKSAFLFGRYEKTPCLTKFGSSKEACQAILALEDDTIKQGSIISYWVNVASNSSAYRAHAYAIYGKLASDPNYYFCLDSYGNVVQKVPASKAIYTTCTN